MSQCEFHADRHGEHEVPDRGANKQVWLCRECFNQFMARMVKVLDHITREAVKKVIK